MEKFHLYSGCLPYSHAILCAGLQPGRLAGLRFACRNLQPRSAVLVCRYEQLVPSPGACNKVPAVRRRHSAIASNWRGGVEIP